VLDPTPVEGLPRVFRQRGQGGLMDVVLHPEFASNRLLYLSYGKPSENDSLGATAVVRGRLEGNRLTAVEEVFVADQWSPRNNHFAGRMAFDPAGYLFLTVGDRLADPKLQAAHPSQDPTHDFGTVLRLHDDGKVPSDNPFVGRAGVRPEIWSYGHRNPQGLAVHPETGEVWLNEHGPRGGDELNLVLPGRNYGWPVATYGINYDGTIITGDTRREGMESPRWVWIPSIATSGMLFYTGDRFPWWKGSLFIGGLVGEQLARVSLEGHEVRGVETLLAGALGRIRDVRQGPDGLIYLAIDDQSNPPELSAVVRLEPVASDVRPPR
jgi:glucose/arabinose dehydrogenase